MKKKIYFSVGSPIVLIGGCALSQFVTGYFLGVWAWVPTMFLFWLLIAIFLVRYSEHQEPLLRFKKGNRSLIWPIVAVVSGFFSLHGFLDNWSLLTSPVLVVSWLAFAILNPWFEESYWRGLIIDSTRSWGRSISLLYSSTLFALSHFLIWGIHATAFHKLEVLGGIFFVGLLWGLIYMNTRSLRWCVLGHTLANFLGLAALVLLNLYDPAAR